MRSEDIIRAWKDESYRATLDEMPAHPAGMLELEDADLEAVAGGDVVTSVITTSVWTSIIISEIISDIIREDPC